MPTDVGGLDPITVSMRDYIDEHRETHERFHAKAHEANEKLFFQALEAIEQRITVLENVYQGNRTEDQHKVEVALEAVGKASQIHATAHEQQHTAHEQIHLVEKENLEKAAFAMDKRLEGLNDLRNVIRDRDSRFVEKELDAAQNGAMQKQIELNRNELAELRLLIATKVNRDENKIEFRGDTRAAQTLRNSTIGTMIAIATLVLSITIIVVNLLLVP